MKPRLRNAEPMLNRRCPINGREYPLVSAATINQHLRAPWKQQLENHKFYCCDDPDCQVTYFNEANETITVNQLRDAPGLKTRKLVDTLCYCFGVTNAEAVNESVKAFVVSQTKLKTCSCKTRNPFGRCCLKDFPK